MSGRRRISQQSLLAAGCLAAALFAAGTPAARAQAPSSAGSGDVEYSFTNPGARSLAMGGAFAGRADDATAAYANPAGLVQLTRPEVSVEVRRLTFPAGSGLPTRNSDGSIAPPEAIDGDTTGVAFASYVHPYKRWTFALYRTTLADYAVRSGAESTDVALFGYGFAGAYRFDHGLSVGAVLLRYQGRFESSQPCFTLEGPCSGTLTQRLDDNDLAANVGVLWQPGDRWSVGAVYRRGPHLEGDPPREPPAPEIGEVGGLVLRVPDVVAVGFAVRPTSRWVVNGEWSRVRHSQSLSWFDPTIRRDGRVLGRMRLDDVDQLHLGAEVSFWNRRGAPALRFGAWVDPAHRPRFAAAGALDPAPRSDGSPSDAEIAALLAVQFPGGEDRLHLSAGFGFVFGRRFQLDAAADVSDETETYALSTLVRF